MKVTLIIWISAIILQEVEPGTLARIPRDVANLKSSIRTEYEANYQQKGKHGNDSCSTIKGNQEILHDNCNDTWNEFAEKCASLVKDLIASLANTISSSPGDATNLQLHIKNNFTHVDKSHNRNCFKNPPTCLSKLNFSSLFNNETGNILNKPDVAAPISVVTTLKKADSFEEDSPIPVQPSDTILGSSSESPEISQQVPSLDHVKSSHINPEEVEALTDPQINNHQPVKNPTSELEQIENTALRPEDSKTGPSTESRLAVIPLNKEDLSPNRELHIAFDPNDMALEISAVPSNPPYNIPNTSPNPYSDGLSSAENPNLAPSTSNEDTPSREALGIASSPYSSSENSNELLPNSVDSKSSLSPKYTSKQVSSEEVHTYLPPQSLVGEPLISDSQQLHEEFESDEMPGPKEQRHIHHGEDDHFPLKIPPPPAHEHHLPHPKILNEEPVIPHHSFVTPTTAPPVLLNPVTIPVLVNEHSKSKEPSPPLLPVDHAPDLSQTNASPHSISHQDPVQELKPDISHPPNPIGNQPIIIDNSTPVLTPVSESKKTQPENLPALASNAEPPAKEVSHDDYLNGNQPPSPLESVTNPESTKPQILSVAQPSNNPLEASSHLSQQITQPVVSAEELVSSEHRPNNGSPENGSYEDKSAPSTLLLIPTVESKEPPHDLQEIHQHPPSKTTADEDGDDKKHIPVIVSEEIPLSPKRELENPKIELVPVSPSEKELPPPPPKPEFVPVLVPEKELPPPPPPKVELVPVPSTEKEFHPPPPPPPKVELVPVIPTEKEHPPPPPPKVELVPVHAPEKELPPPPPPPPKVELVPVIPLEKEHPTPPPPPPKIELVPVPPPEKELPPPPPPPPKIELVPVPLPEKELPPPPPPPPKVELVPVLVPEKEPPPPPPPKIELVPVPSPEKEPPPPPPKKELPPPPPPPPPPPKIELVPVPPPEKELPPPPPPPKVELVPVLVPEKEPPPPPPKKELPPPPPPPKIELVPVPPPEKELPPPPPPPPKIELVHVPPPEKELPPPPPPPKVELVPVLVPEKELPPPPPKKELPPPPPPPPKIELVPVLPPEKELPPPPKVKLVPYSSSEHNEIPSHEKAFGDMPWSHPPHQHHPHPPPPHFPHHHHHPHKKEEDDDSSPLYSSELPTLEDEKELEGEKGTTFQTTSADPTPPESSLVYPPFFTPNPTSPPLTIPNSESYPLMPSPTTFKTVPAVKKEENENEYEDDEEESCCSCESWATGDKSDGQSHRTSACQDLEQARRELKAIFDKIKKKLKCGRKTQKPTIT